MNGEDLRTEAEELATEWFTMQCVNPYGAFYLYMKPAPDGRLIVAEEAPEGYELVQAERLSPAWDKPTVAYKIYHWARRLPVLG